MKKIFFLTLFFFNALISSSQIIKTFNGKYDLEGQITSSLYGYDLDGIANYTYYQNAEYERIKTNKFTYNGKYSPMFTNPKAIITLNVTTNYKNNLRNGAWISNLKVVKGNQLLNGKTSLNYENGTPNGLWRFDATASTGLTAGPEYTSINFNHNVVYNFMMLNYDLKIKVSGQCNTEGYLNGKISIVELESKNTGIETICSYENGFLISELKRYFGSGDIISNEKTSDDEVQKFITIQKLMKENNKTQLENLSYKLIDENHPDLGYYFFKGFTTTSASRQFPGDNSYLNKSDSYNWVGFKIRILEENESESVRLARVAQEEKTRQEKEEKKQQEILVNNFNLAYETLQVKNENVQKKYNVVDEILTAATGITVYKTKKKKFLFMFTTLMDDLLKEINDSKSNEEKLNLTNEAISIAANVINLFDQNTNDLEKKLKNAATRDEFKTLLK